MSNLRESCWISGRGPVRKCQPSESAFQMRAYLVKASGPSLAGSITMVSSTRSRPLLFLEAFLQLSEIVRQAKTVVRKRTSGVDKSHGHDFAGKLREPDLLPILVDQGE